MSCGTTVVILLDHYYRKQALYKKLDSFALVEVEDRKFRFLNEQRIPDRKVSGIASLVE